MLAAALLAACLTPPFYPADFAGPDCPIAAEAIECRCSECMTWDAVDRADVYEVQRTTVSTGAVYDVGEVQRRVVDEDGGTGIVERWCFAADVPMVRAGTLYQYAIRACYVREGARVCSSGWSNPVLYRAAPHDCWAAGREVACYTGDSVTTR